MEKLVEDVVRSLNFLLLSNTGLLKKVGHDVTTAEFARCSEVDSDELSEPGGVVVPCSLGVAVGLQDGVGVDDTILQVGFLLLLGLASLLLSFVAPEDGKV